MLFFTDKQALGLLCAALGFTILGATYLVRWITQLPEYTFLAAESTLNLRAGRQKGTLTKKYRIRPNHAHLRRITFRNIAADGRIGEIRWNDRPVPAASIREKVGTFEVDIDFPYAHRRWKAFDGELAYEVEDSFEKPVEELIFEVDFHTRKVELKVLLPKDLPARSARVLRMSGSENELAELDVTGPGATELRYAVKRPRLAHEYAIRWMW
jgi:hypothetical protein